MNNRNLGDIPQNLRRDSPARPGSNKSRQITRATNVITRALFSEQISVVDDSGTQPVLNQNSRRNYLLIQNNGAGDVFINFGNKANTGSLKIIAGGNYEPAIVPINSVYLVSGAGLTNGCVIVEGVEIN